MEGAEEEIVSVAKEDVPHVPTARQTQVRSLGQMVGAGGNTGIQTGNGSGSHLVLSLRNVDKINCISEGNLQMAHGRYINSLRKLASNGDVAAMWTLGDAYDSGFFFVKGKHSVEHVCRNRRLARKWLRRAANNGCTGAMIALASLYTNCMRRNRKGLEFALELEKRAWNMGEKLAANNVAITYSILGDSRRCYMWLEKYYSATGDGVLLALSLAAGYGTRVNYCRAKCILKKMVANSRFNEYDVKRQAQCLLKLLRSGNIPAIAIPISKTVIESECD